MLQLATLATGFLIFLSLTRAAIGPTAADRIVAINTVGTKVITLLALIGVATEQYFYLDVAMVYAMISFLDSIGFAKFFEFGRLFHGER